ncbi:MAG: OmpA family protein [Halieaceae bacterium]|jgi:outer membrane protein OmpA-like peptidoglycan-associated protein|nr:OmpA family protein [Halieaceae bacterium]
MKFLILLIFFTFSLSPLALAWDVDKPFDPDATMAAQSALKELGENNGALKVVSPTPLSLLSESLAIEGLSGLSLKADVQELNKAIDDLEAEVTETQIKIDLSSDVIFDFDKADLKQETLESLQSLATIVEQKATKVEIFGHTDSRGSNTYNQGLSERRAMSVKTWLLTNTSFSRDLIHTKGLGETKPRAPNEKEDGSDNPVGRVQNRRVEILIFTQS